MSDTMALGSRARWTPERRFFTLMSIAMLVAVYVGFARSFFLRPLFPEWQAPAEPVFYVHGAFFTAWMVLLVTQALLIATRRVDLHRRLGMGGAALAVGMVALGLLGSLVAASRPTGFNGVPVPPLQFLVVPFFDLVCFTIFFSLAIAHRGDAQSHKRLMLLATISMLGAAFARWPYLWQNPNPFVFYGLADVFIVALVVWDFRTRGGLHPVTRWGGLALILSVPARLALSGTAAWLDFAAWLTGLVR
jgi:uncharacterized membrane protein YozB (DUF420 family)